MKNPVTQLGRIPFTVWVLAFAASGYFLPDIYTWSWHGWEPRDAIGPLVQVIMFGMGVSLTFADFTRVLRLPRAVAIGVSCQYLLMPVLAWTFSSIWNLEPTVAVGLVLVGSCPGGVASNVIAYIARANVPLSVTMTACSTLLSPLITPLALQILVGRDVPIAVAPMMTSIIRMVLVPVILGLLANHFASHRVKSIRAILPPIAMLAICVIIAITIALARDSLSTVGPMLLAAAACHNAAGYLLGYGLAYISGLSSRDCRTVALEVGIQNGGMATGLAMNVLKSPVIALGISCIWPVECNHKLSPGIILAGPNYQF